MSSYNGKNIHYSIFGQSHSDSIGIVIEGLPAGFKPDINELKSFLGRRAPGNDSFSTPRKEADLPIFLSGLVNDTCCGAPLTAVIKNTNTRSNDYDNLRVLPRPGHADFPAHIKYHGFQDVSGGGHFSGRLTAPLCIAGGLCMQLLKEKGITVRAHIKNIHGVEDEKLNSLDPREDFKKIEENSFPVISKEKGDLMIKEILKAKENLNSVGGIIECAVTGLPAGIGDPMFEGLENIIAKTVFAIPGVKGIEFGAGFDVANLMGSENNDEYIVENNNIRTATNNHGGILGGISTGMPLIFSTAFKPTSSIARAQRSVDLKTKEEKELKVHGRHDPCIVPRAVPVVEAAAAVAVYDSYLSYLTMEAYYGLKRD